MRALAVLCVLLACRIARAQEGVTFETPPATSVEESDVEFDRAYADPPRGEAIDAVLEEWQENKHPFLRDSTFALNLRSYYFYRDKYDGSVSEAWALGGALTYKSGYVFERFGIGAALYTSQPLHAPEERDGTLLLRPGQEGYTVFGQLYGEFKIADGILVNLYRQTYNTPYLNRNDNRMTPNTFEGYSITGRHGGEEGGDPKLAWGAGYVAKIKERNSDDFVWMSQDAGATVKRGVIVAGGRWTEGGASIGLVDYYCEDILNIFYAEAKYTRELRDGLGALVAGQFSHQSSAGDDLLTGSSFSTLQFGFKAELSFGGALLSCGYTRNSRDAALRNPWSSYPGYTSSQVLDFNRAGEQAVVVKATYDLSKAGVAGVTFYALWVHGWGRIDGPNEEEVDLDLQWRPSAKALKGLSCRVRYAHTWEEGESGNPQQDFRVIVNWDF